MKMYQVDAFTTELFKGNPAAVIVTEHWLDEVLMQNIALENNLAETAFVKMLDAENYEIRWFTPTTEVNFCGHATLASSFVLFKDYTAAKTLRFHVKELGIFVVSQEADGKIKMNFPIRRAKKITHYPEILKQILSKPFKNVFLNHQAYIMEYANPQDVRDEKPNLELLKQWTLNQAEKTQPKRVLDLAITAQAAAPYDCISRYFAPAKIRLPVQFILRLRRFGQRNWAKKIFWLIRHLHVGENYIVNCLKMNGLKFQVMQNYICRQSYICNIWI